MIVANWMSAPAITLRPEDSIATAVALMKQKRIRRIPIVSDSGELVGIVSDRDLKEVSPSRASTLDIWELHYVLDRLKLADIMTKKPWTVKPETPIEKAALLMMRKRVEGLPVLDDARRVVGIVTEGDVFRALVELTGVGKRRIRISLLVPDEPGSIREVADVCRARGARIHSVLGSYAKVPAGQRELVMRVEGPEVEELRAALSQRFGEVRVEED
jgi:acetoin utilization protein AcuB